jgi:hypothetical protein
MEDKPKEGQIVTHQEESLYGMVSVEHAAKLMAQLQQFIKSQMKKDIDFGIIPGTKKRSLYKPGAEKLLNLHGLACELTPVREETIVQWGDEKRGVEPFFNYCYTAKVFNPRSGVVLATCQGSCNSKEAKYAYNWLTEKKVPKGINLADLPWKERDGEHGTYKVYRVPVEDPFSQVNTLQKMAQKRAMIGATLQACRASDIFMVEEEDGDGEKSAGGGGKKTDGPHGDPISEPRLKRLYAIIKESGVKEADLKAYVGKKCPYTVDEKGDVHLSKIGWKIYDEICKWAAIPPAGQ